VVPPNGWGTAVLLFARRSGVEREAVLSTPAFYRHFRSKDELLVGLLEQGWDTLRGYAEHEMAKQAEAVGRITA
jgi:AcrR family transcriptional regulator